MSDTPPSRNLQQVAKPTNTPPPAYVEYDLYVPLEVNGVETCKVRIRRPKLRDIQAAYERHGEGFAAEVGLMGDLLELQPDQVANLDSYDFGEIQKIMSGFRNTRSSK